ncbi:MAG: chemotaxis response regulator protein-glutamate methylesterase [Oscillospiraceae bacterium]
MKKIRLLVVDDSILFREVLSRYIRQDDEIEVVGTAGDPYNARDMILKYDPDVMTLDIEMPRMDGLEFLRKLLPQYYLPAVVVSSSDSRKKEALDIGAVDFIQKPLARTSAEMKEFAVGIGKAVKEAYRKNASGAPTVSAKGVKSVKAAAEPAGVTHTEIPRAERSEIPSAGKKFRKSDVVLALGASTGGTEALEQVIRNLPADCPATLVVQHMPAGFTKMYSDRLNKSCPMDVKEAEDGDRLRRGLVIIGAGEYHLRLCKDSRGYYVSSKNGDKVSGHCPSVDVLFTSVAENAKGNAIGVILTGMGRDGADGLLKMHNAGAFTVGQDKETCVVYGMPMEAYKIGAVQVQAPLYKIADIIQEQLI